MGFLTAPSHYIFVLPCWTPPFPHRTAVALLGTVDMAEMLDLLAITDMPWFLSVGLSRQKGAYI